MWGAGPRRAGPFSHKKGYKMEKADDYGNPVPVSVDNGKLLQVLRYQEQLLREKTKQYQEARKRVAIHLNALSAKIESLNRQICAIVSYLQEHGKQEDAEKEFAEAYVAASQSPKGSER